MTALVISAPIRHSATRFISRRISALICSGDFPRTRGNPSARAVTGTGKFSSNSLVRRPIRRLMLVTTRSGSSARRRKAFAPTSIEPSAPIHTVLGVIRRPSSLASRIGNPESTTPTAELVVPKSIPKIKSLIAASFVARRDRVNAASRNLSSIPPVAWKPPPRPCYAIIPASQSAAWILKSMSFPAASCWANHWRSWVSGI